MLKAGVASLLSTAGSPSCLFRNGGSRQTRAKMIVLGFDGMDPGILERLMDRGRMPAFRRLREQGAYRRLRTSLPPQSPVAWSNFITGMDPGGHGIFDFVHRNPADYLPFLSTSRVEAPRRTITMGDYVLPVSSGETELLRKGRAFWQILEEFDVPATIVQIPSNFPPAETSQRTLAGMGTPDLLGTYGIFSYYTTSPMELKPDIGGGRIYEVIVADNRVEAAIEGPPNTFRKSRPASSVPFKVFLDPEYPVAKIVMQENEFILKQGEWSDWKKISFPLIATQAVRGICRFHLREVRPEFRLYVSPINLDPADPALPISTPAGYSRELASAVGPFFTKGLPADTMALSHGVLDEAEFLAQDESVLQESLRLFERELGRFESGLWFHYFSSCDQRQHMFLPLLDPTHPVYDPGLAARYGNAVENAYAEMDRILGRTLEKADGDTLVVAMSDHGFTQFRRHFNLNTWLLENGFMKLIEPWNQDQAAFFENTDWRRTRAYALGFNGLYLNLKGRERDGIVEPKEKEALIREIRAGLEKAVDPFNGERVIRRAYIASEAYHGPMTASGPDIVVGYNAGYRASAGTVLGRLPEGQVGDNNDKWGGDHCMDPEFVPGILFANRPVRAADPSLCDLTATILALFEIAKPQEMLGTGIL